jgi:hypothetical protein
VESRHGLDDLDAFLPGQVSKAATTSRLNVSAGLPVKPIPKKVPDIVTPS